MRETRHTFCRICEALCGLVVTLEDGKVVEIMPDPSHVATQGFCCVKGLKQHILFDSPDRLKSPLKRVGTEWQQVSWERAIGEIGEQVRRIRSELGPDAIAMYVGSCAGLSILHPIFALGFVTGVGSKSVYSSATQDCSNKFTVATQMYGFPFIQPFPDLNNTRCLIITGANPVVSKWCVLQVANPVKRLREIEARGGKVYFVDPRRTESARVAGEHLPIRPNTDVFFLLSFLHELISSGGVDRERTRRWMTGLEKLERLAESWPPERTAEVTRIPAGRLREMVAAYREAQGAALYSATGVNMGTNGSLACWLEQSINAISGNLDHKGGTLVGRGVIDFPKFGKKHGMLLRNDRSRIGGFTSVSDAFPGGILADEIITPGPGQVRALFVSGGNPIITMPNSAHLREALSALELLVVTDLTLNETASLAHYVLPTTSPLQRPDLPFIFPLMLGLQTRPYLQATERILEPEGEQRDEATIYLDLARASGLSLFGSKVGQVALELSKKIHSARHPNRKPAVPQELLLSLLLRVTGQSSFKRLLGSPHGIARQPHRDNDFLGKRVLTDDGRVNLAPEVLIEQARKLESDFSEERANADRLKLITKRTVTSHNSWTHNLEEFVPDGHRTNYLYIHGEDAERAGLKEGDFADVASETGAVRLPVKLSSDLMTGTVALQHGWGHQYAKGLSVASKTSGVNVNLLTADGPEKVERLSGMAHLTGILVDVKPAAAPPDEKDWSGIPDA